MNPLDRACRRPHGPDCVYVKYSRGQHDKCTNRQCIRWRGSHIANVANCRAYLPQARRIRRDYKRIARRVLAAYCLAVAIIATGVFGTLVIIRLVTFFMETIPWSTI